MIKKLFLVFLAFSYISICKISLAADENESHNSCLLSSFPNFDTHAFPNLVQGKNNQAKVGSLLNYIDGDQNNIWVLSNFNNINGEHNSIAYLSLFNSIEGGQSDILFLSFANHLTGYMNTIALASVLNMIRGHNNRLQCGSLNFVSGNKNVCTGIFNIVRANNVKVLGFFNYISEDDTTFIGCFSYPIIPISRFLYRTFKYCRLPRSYLKCIDTLKKPKYEIEHFKLVDQLFATYFAINTNSEFRRQCKSEIKDYLINYLNTYGNELDSYSANKNLDVWNAYKEKVKKLSAVFIETKIEQIEPVDTEDRNQEEANKNEICLICLDEVDLSKEDRYVLSCKHIFHLSCLQSSLSETLDQGSFENFKTCQHSCCKKELSTNDLSTIACTASQIIKIQKTFLRALDIFWFCPKCDLGLHLKTCDPSTICRQCMTSSCFSCGLTPHKGISCEDASNLTAERNTLIESLRGSPEENIGLCPRCSNLIIKFGGCDEVTCGRNAVDKNFIGSSEGRGCDHTFMWDNRIKLSI